MTTTDNNQHQQPALRYDFARPDLWEGRIGSLDDTLDATFKLFHQSVVGIGGLSPRKLAGLIRDGGGVDFAPLIEEALGDGEEGADQRLIDALDRVLNRVLNPEWIDPLSMALGGLLRTLLRTRQISLSTPERSPSGDADFELKQMLSLYLLVRGLNSFFQASLGDLMQASLAWHRGTQTPPPLHLIRTCLRLAAVDAEVLQRAIIQRRWEADAASGSYTRSLQATSLLVTDKLCAMALAPFLQQFHGWLEVKPLTYFSRETHIHQLPYSDRYVLVGLSYDLITPEASRRTDSDSSPREEKRLPAFELMAIPHEVGHFVYHHAHLKDEMPCLNLSDAFADNPYQRWCEELFADVYSCLVAGPLTALGLQAILATGDRAQIGVDDSEHPTPIVRPFLLSEILRELGRQYPERYTFPQAIESLDANWLAILTRWGFETIETSPIRIRLPGQADEYRETVFNVQTVVTAVRPMIERFVRSLLENVDFTPWKGDSQTELSADIPWIRADSADLARYDDDMARLSGGDVAYRAVPAYQISHWGSHWLGEAEEKADEELESFVARWIDSGPTGHGDHG